MRSRDTHISVNHINNGFSFLHICGGAGFSGPLSRSRLWHKYLAICILHIVVQTKRVLIDFGYFFFQLNVLIFEYLLIILFNKCNR